MTGEFGLVDPEEAEAPGDEWPELDVSDTEADRIARDRDREFDEFRKRIRDADQFKVEDSVFDDATFAALYKLVQDGYIAAFGGPLSTGKEANVYEALAGDRARNVLADEDVSATTRTAGEIEGSARERGRSGQDPADELAVAVKVYRINASNFRDMREYLVGDPRFEELGAKKKIVLAWTRKELSNLERARAAGVRVPTPIAAERNVLVMEYVGAVGERGRRLDEVHVENPETAYEVVREYVRRLYDAGLVHGDLSEYNLLVHDGELVVIDVGQAVTIHHPNAGEFLDRDCENVAAFFSRQGVDADGDELAAWVRENADPTN